MDGTLMAVMLSGLVLGQADYAAENLTQIKAQVDAGKAFVVDVREVEEWDAGHLKQAVFLPLTKLRLNQERGTLRELTAELARSVPAGARIYCHCRSGRRVLVAAPILRQMGYDAWPIKPGFGELRDAGWPAVSE